MPDDDDGVPLRAGVLPVRPALHVLCNILIGEGESYYAKEQTRSPEAGELDPRTFDLICIGCSALPPSGFSGFTGFAG
jgi:hypothetical protein